MERLGLLTQNPALAWNVLTHATIELWRGASLDLLSKLKKNFAKNAKKLRTRFLRKFVHVGTRHFGPLGRLLELRTVCRLCRSTGTWSMPHATRFTTHRAPH